MTADSFASILQRRYGRRSVLRGAAIGALALGVSGRAMAAKTLLPQNLPEDAMVASGLTFREVAKGRSATHLLPPGYSASIVSRWGDAVLPSAKGEFQPQILTSAEQSRRFGYNNDFLAYLPLPRGEQSAYHGLLHVNHEYSNAAMMFEGGGKNLTPEQMRIEQAAHGISVLEVRRGEAGWQSVMGSPYARRVTATTPIAISGPAAGHKRMRTKADPTGKRVLGTVGNCSGGVTPWGTVLVAEENFDGYFNGTPTGAEAENHARYQVAKKPYYQWHKIDARFDVSQTPNEPNRFGWVVEYDPYNPQSQPVKRTALGRFKHETATCVVAPDGRLVVYSGDDDEFEYIYRFVSRKKVNTVAREANHNLLDEGTLSVARFHADGSLQWLPLVHGHGPLTEANGFTSQAEVLIETRRAADLLGATPMDRPEGIAVHPQTGEVFVSLTRNTKRKQANIANPRAKNKSGHMVRLQPPGQDHTAQAFGWEMFIVAGDPGSEQTTYSPQTSARGWFSCPDNLTFDPQGRLWIATDGMEVTHGVADGLYATEVSGAGEATPKAFFRVPTGAESCGPAFTPDSKTLFLAVQHPGEGGSFARPTTRWPDFDENLPPRPSVIAITKDDNGGIGS